MNIAIKKGTTIASPIRARTGRKHSGYPTRRNSNLSDGLLIELNMPAREISGHRDLLTFSDGPRIYLWRVFALAEFKVSDIHSLQTHSATELRASRQHSPYPKLFAATKIENHRSILWQLKVAGQEGPKVPLKVKRVDSSL
jgi:hypothetical protein